jgi:hypothetical protein
MKPRAKVPAHKRIKPSGKSSTHLDLIRQLPCLLSGRPAEVAHIRYADADHGKEVTGMQRKPDDRWVVPLCPELHRMATACQHSADERKWWAQFGVDPLKVAEDLWGLNLAQMELVIEIRTPWKREIKARIAAILKGEK